jgi:hypothetical protein
MRVMDCSRGVHRHRCSLPEMELFPMLMRVMVTMMLGQ